MTDHNLTDDDLRKAHEFARRYANDEYVPERDRAAARVILAHVPDPGPAKLTEWSEDLVGTWVSYPHHEGPLMLLKEGIDPRAVFSLSPTWGVGLINLESCTPRHDLAPADLTPRPVTEPETTPRTVTTADEYAALPEGSVVAQPEDGVLLLMSGRWHDPLGRGPYTHDLMRGITSVLLREGWGE